MTLNPAGTPVGRSIIEQVELKREPLVALCARLVNARSVNPEGDTREVAAVVTAALQELGIQSRLERSRETMPSVVAEIDSGRPGRHLVVNVHLDTMPPGDEDLWSVPPWQLTRKEGRLYGLGMGNMKGAVAAMVHAVGLIHERREEWSGRLTFTAVSDEVVFGDHGAAHLLAIHPDLIGDGMICGEGAGFKRLAVGEKGVLWLTVSTVGDPGHSSSVVRGESATARLAQAVSAIDGLNGTRGWLSDALSVADSKNALTLTANVGTMTAGTFIGQRATSASAQVDLRLPPGIGVDEAERLVRHAVDAVLPDASAELIRIKGWDPGLTSPVSSIARSWRQAEEQAGSVPADLAIRLPASDASRWRSLGTPAICFGPQPGLSAGIDDYAEEDEVLRCAALYALAALNFLSPEEMSS